MKDIFYITKFYILSNYKLNFSDKKHNLFRYFTYAISIGGLLLFSTLGIANIYLELNKLNADKIIISFLFTGITLFCIIKSLSKILSLFCFSKNNEFFLRLPITIPNIFLGKFFYCYLSLLPISAIILPSLITYGVLSNASFLYYIDSMLSIVLIPIVPIFYSLIISFMLTSINIKPNYKKFFKNFIVILIFVFLIFLCSFIMDSSSLAKIFTKILNTSINNNLSFIDILFPINFILVKGLVSFNNIEVIKSLGLTLIITFILSLLSTFICSKLYKKILLISSNNETEENTRKVTFKETNSPLLILVKRDLKILFRNSHYFSNIFIFLALCSCILIIIAFVLNSNPSSNSDALAALFLFSNLSIMFSGCNLASFTSFSREGHYFNTFKTFPLDKNTLLKSKLLVSYSIGGLYLMVALILLLIIKMPFFKLITILAVTFLAMTLTILSSTFDDIHKPVFNWSDEKDLLNQGILKIFKPLIFAYGDITIFFIFMFSQLKSINNSFYIAAIILSAIKILLSFIYYKRILKNLNNLFTNN